MPNSNNNVLLPRWAKDLKRFLPLKSQFVLNGNVRDLYPLAIDEEQSGMFPLCSYLGCVLKKEGMSHFINYNIAQGFSIPDIIGIKKAEEKKFFEEKFSINLNTKSCNTSVEGFFETLDKLVKWKDEPIVIFVDFAARMLLRADAPSEGENQNFTKALITGHVTAARPIDRTPFFNPVIWITDKEGDLPDWFVIGNSKIRQIQIPKPDHVIRATVAKKLSQGLSEDSSSTISTDEKEKLLQLFVDGTQGMLVSDLNDIVKLMMTEGLGISEIEEAVKRYKLGVTEDPWKKIDRSKLRNGKEIVQKRVKGQDAVVQSMLDIIKRAASGLSSSKGASGRPRGVAFLAGPTGVGKTELAKTITELLFGDESAYIRFDMSEFSAEHSDQRLIGAPPGYVGYDVGGELTNAVREKPFSVVLFDEIEKAHPKILDKFLQVLDDGVLTSGRGERIYFSETFIIFTSNLGIYKNDDQGKRVLNVSEKNKYADIAKNVRTEIEQYFKVQLGRPEILNRLGENLLVFDFIRKDIAVSILDSMVKSFFDGVKSGSDIDISMEGTALSSLKKMCLEDLSNGGRGIRNKLEAHLINPVSRELFDQDIKASTKVVITDLKSGPVTTMEIRIE
jgi:hypothetical protein